MIGTIIVASILILLGIAVFDGVTTYLQALIPSRKKSPNDKAMHEDIRIDDYRGM